MDEEIKSLARWLLINSQYYFDMAMEEAESLIEKGEDPRND